MSDLAGNPEDRFSHNEAHLMIIEGYFLSVFHKYISSAEEEIKCIFDDN